MGSTTESAPRPQLAGVGTSIFQYPRQPPRVNAKKKTETPARRNSIKDNELEDDLSGYPEGGTEAWLVVLGA
jgi:hypothetical protein